MGLLNARLTARRYRVAGELQEGFREIYRDRLGKFAFQEPPNIDKAQIEGWTLIQDVTESSFDDFNQWFIDDWILFGLRTDKRVLPAKIFRATVEREVRAWAKEQEVSRVPASVRAEIRDTLERAWLARVMPRTQHHEISWNIQTNRLYISTHSDAACDSIRKRFYRTFGRRLVPFSPLEWVGDDEDLIVKLLAGSPMALGPTP